jgi:ATP-dependent RNA helicase DDX56/DBP9
VAIRETRAAEVRAEILNSERLASHFDENPADLQLLQHDRGTVHISKVQDHLKHVPKYMLPRGMAVSESVGKKKRKKKTRSQRLAQASSARNKANDPLQNFDGDVDMGGLLAAEAGDGEGDAAAAVDEDKFFDGGEEDNDEEITKEEKNQAYLDNAGDDGFGKSTAGRNAWKQKHSKGKFNRKVLRTQHEQLHKW